MFQINFVFFLFFFLFLINNEGTSQSNKPLLSYKHIFTSVSKLLNSIKKAETGNHNCCFLPVCAIKYETEMRVIYCHCENELLCSYSHCVCRPLWTWSCRRQTGRSEELRETCRTKLRWSVRTRYTHDIRVCLSVSHTCTHQAW